MQLYEGLPIITNKITIEERKGIPHHLLGCIGLDEPTWVVGTFVKRALSVIEEIRARGKLPILVGGTHYYTQSLLFKDALASKSEDNGDNTDGEQEFVPDLTVKFPVLNESTERLLEELEKVDPVMAQRWHPKDRRKIQRSLEIYLQTGRPASDVYEEQRQAKLLRADNASTCGGLRFPALVFWINAEAETLRARLDSRVNRMFDRGLLDEVSSLDLRLRSSDSIDGTKGIFVSIGYKEFQPYLDAVRSGVRSEIELAALLAEAMEKTKIATRQYAKRQVRWIRHKLIGGLSAVNASQSLYLLDGTEIQDFHSSVIVPALQLTQPFLSASTLPAPISLSSVAAEMLVPEKENTPTAESQKWIREQCKLCDTTCVTEKSWQQHLRSRSHRRLESKARNRDKEVRPNEEHG